MEGVSYDYNYVYSFAFGKEFIKKNLRGFL